jgi:hypothetical protein
MYAEAMYSRHLATLESNDHVSLSLITLPCVPDPHKAAVTCDCCGTHSL